MKRRFYGYYNLLLGSLIVMLGLCGCRCSRQAAKEIECVYGPPPEVEESIQQEELRQQRLKLMEEARQDSLRRAEQQRRQEMKVVYGPPPAYRE